MRHTKLFSIMTIIFRFGLTARCWAVSSFLLLAGGSLFAQRGGGGVKWGKDGKSYYAIENNTLVRYDLPAFQKTVVLDAGLLTPPGQSQPLAIQAFSFSDDEKKILLYTNSKKVWRLNTRGDYWVLDPGAHTLKQLGKSRPAASLMFAKLAPDGTKAA
jgi:dipeptidyl-peptidase-4